MPKLIIYLDQNFVSNMAKAKFWERPSPIQKLHEFAVIYDRLKVLVDKERVICPESYFHNLETIEPTMAEAAQRVVAKLSYGLSFRPPQEIIRFQAYKAAREFLNLPPEGTPEWETGFAADPHEPVENRTIQLGKSKLIPTIPWQVDPSPSKPEKYMNDRRVASGKFTWSDLPTRVNEQKAGLIKQIYGNQVDKYSVGEARLLLETWQSLGASKEKLADFMKSDHLRNCPFIDILCTLAGAMDCEKNRRPKVGDAMDTLIMAVVLPYCDIVATSKDMVGLLGQTKLSGSYRAVLYSAKPDDVRDFSSRVALL